MDVDEKMYLVLEGLAETALEKVLVLGEDAKEDVERLLSVASDLVCFWDLDSDIPGVIGRYLRGEF